MSEPRREQISLMGPVHQVFRDCLASVPALIESTRGDTARRELVASYYANVLAFLEVHHEHEEAELFPLLIEKVPHAQAKVENALEQHRQVVPLLAEAMASVADWATRGDAGAEQVVSALEALERPLSVHLDYEVEALDPIIEEYLTADELGPIGVEGFKGDKIWLVFGLASEQMSEEQRAAATERTSPLLQKWWENEGRPSFNTMMAEIRRAI